MRVRCLILGCCWPGASAVDSEVAAALFEAHYAREHWTAHHSGAVATAAGTGVQRGPVAAGAGDDRPAGRRRAPGVDTPRAGDAPDQQPH
jgi:hypothetical protein